MSKMDHKESSSSIEENKIDSQELIQKAENIVQFLMEKHWASSERYKKARIELDELKNKYQEALKSWWKITRLELRLLQKEYEDVSDNASWVDKWNIESWKDYWLEKWRLIHEEVNNIWNIKCYERYKWTYDLYLENDWKVTKIKEYFFNFKPDVEDFKLDFLLYKSIGFSESITKEELKYLLKENINAINDNNRFDNLLDSLSWLARSAWFDSSTLWDLALWTEAFSFDLLEKYFDGKWYNENWEIMQYDEKNWYTIWNITEVENDIKNKNPEEVWDIAIVNYYKYLWENSEKLVEAMGDKKAYEVIKYLEKRDSSENDLFDSILNSIKDIAINTLNIIVKKFKEKVLDSGDTNELKENLDKISVLEEDDKSILINELKEELENENNKLRSIFYDAIYKKVKSENENKDESYISNESEILYKAFLQEFKSNLNIDSLHKAIKSLKHFEEEYSVEVEYKNVMKVASSSIAIEKEISYIEYPSNDENYIKVQESNITDRFISEMTDEDINNLKSWNVTWEETREKIFERNKTLKKDYEEYKKDKEEIENKKSEDKDNTPTENNETNNTNLTYTSWNEVYSYNAWNIITTTWETIALNPEEIKQIDWNQDMMKNIVNFYENLDVLWLSDLWEYRNNIFKAISNIQGIWFDTKSGDYLNENEVKLFLNAILKSTDKKEIEMSKSMHEFNNLFLIENDKTFLNDKNDATKKWDSTISEIFIEKYALWTIFDYTALEDNLRK